MHYAGVACEMDAILAIGARHHVTVIEDSAHGFFGRYRARPLGSFGALAALSFHETKNISCGEGGALLINDPALAPRAEILREKGTNRAAFFRGHVDRYSWVDLGSATSRPTFSPRSSGRNSKQPTGFSSGDTRSGAATPSGSRRGPLRRASGCLTFRRTEHPAHLFYLVLPSPADRVGLIAHLRDRDIASVFHYVPLHASPMGRRWHRAPCPVAEQVAERLVRLPFYAEFDPDTQDRVIDAVAGYRVAGAVHGAVH